MKVHDLGGLVMVLKKALEMLEEAKLDDVLMAIGSTGCGKSTLLAALLVGP